MNVCRFVGEELIMSVFMFLGGGIDDEGVQMKD
jgi:hypothetical protein